MLQHPYLAEKLANDHQNDLLREADSHRMARRFKKDRPAQASLSKPLVERLAGLLTGPLGRWAEQGPFYTESDIKVANR